MSDICTTIPTETLYSTQYSIVVQTAISNGIVNGSEVVSSYLITSTATEATPTETLYETSCGVEATSTALSSSRNRGQSVSASVTTRVLPTSTATLISKSTAANNPASIVLVTSYSTMSATSVFVVFQTLSNTKAASPTASTLQANTNSSSSHAGPIAGGIVAAVVLIALLGVLAWCIRKRTRRDRGTRALDDFFKDALNPGDAGLAGGAIAGGTVSRRGTMRRKSSTIYDLEKEKNLSHSNDEGNWAALTRISTSMGGHDDEFVDCPSRSHSRLSMNGISRGASIRSYGAEDALAGGWDGRPLMEEPEASAAASAAAAAAAADNRPTSIRSRSSLVRSLYDHGRPMSTQSIEHPALSPGLTMQSASTGDVSPQSEEDIFPLPAYASHKPSRPVHARFQHHLSMSGISPMPHRTASPSITPMGQSIPERPKSALGIMAVPEPLSPRLRHPSLQQFHPTPTRKAVPLQSRASITGYGHYGFQAQASPPLRPIRMASAQQIRSGASKMRFLSEYPPSRYSHLDIVNQEAMPGREGEAQNTFRQRSLSGSILVKTAASLSDDVGVTDSDPSSSASTSLKAPRMTRSSSPEDVTEEEEEQSRDVETAQPNAATLYNEKMNPPVVERSKSPFNGMSPAEDKKPAFWQPQAWRARA